MADDGFQQAALSFEGGVKKTRGQPSVCGLVFVIINGNDNRISCPIIQRSQFCFVLPVVSSYAVFLCRQLYTFASYSLERRVDIRAAIPCSAS